MNSLATPSVTASSLVPSPSSAPFRPLSETLPPLSPLDHSTLVQWDECLRRAVLLRRAATMAVAYYGWRIKKSQRWHEFGFKTEDDYRQARGISKWTWWNCMRIGQVLESLPFDELATIETHNATALTNVEPDIWLDYPWISEARTLNRNQFISLVRDRNRLFRGDPEADPRRLTHVRVSAKLKQIRDSNELKSMAEALEYVLSKPSADASAELLAAAKHAYKLIGLVLPTACKHSKHANASQASVDAYRILLKTRTRLYDAIQLALKSKSMESGAGYALSTGQNRQA